MKQRLAKATAWLLDPARRKLVIAYTVAVLLPPVVAAALVAILEPARVESQHRVARLRDEVAQMDRRLREVHDIADRRSRLVDRVAVLDHLARDWNRKRNVLLDLSFVPQGVALTRVALSGSVLSIEGEAWSTQLVSIVRQRLHRRGTIHSSDISILSPADERSPLRFELRGVLPSNDSDPVDE